MAGGKPMSDSKKKLNAKTLQSQFSAILTGIQKMRSQAAAAVNEKHLNSVWFVGGLVSRKIKNNEWGAKVVSDLADYIRTEKIEEAKRLLRFTDKPLSAIGAFLGFSSQGHFIGVFRKATGITPGEYREKKQ